MSRWPPAHLSVLLITTDRLLGVTGAHEGTLDYDTSSNQNTFNPERPSNANPTGVAIDGRGDLPEGHANMADKMIGKMQKVNFAHTFLARVCLGLICLFVVVGHWEGYE